jgi:ABC-type phosphate/phosphonate transport system substrate-binding protein
MKWIACTRMYDVTPRLRGHWHALLNAAAQMAQVEIECIDHAPPAPLAALWARDDLALAFMCGFPLATRYPEVKTIAAPVTVLATEDSPTYRSVWVVRASSGFDTIEATFGHRIGWTVENSHSGFNAPRYTLLQYRTVDRPRLFRASLGPLGHPRAALKALDGGEIDVVAIDEYWWYLLQRYDAESASAFRALGHTDIAPMPPLISSATFPDACAASLRAALGALADDPDARTHLNALGIRRFAAVSSPDYDVLARLDRVAREAGYPLPA